MLSPEEKAHILMVDDRPDKLLALEAILAPLGQHLVKAASGQEALKYLLERDFAVILLDVNMPLMDGFETATLIRRRARSEKTPIIFITAVAQTEPDALRGYQLGAVDYIYTPVIPTVLRAKVEVFVDLFKMRQALERQAEHLALTNMELAHRLEEIQRLNRDLAAMNQELEAFSYSVSHDLRAPLRAMDGFSRILLEKYRESLDETGQEYLGRVRGAAERMDRLIDDLLKLSRLSRAEMQRLVVDLSALARQILSELQESQPERIVERRVADGLAARGDEPLLRAALENLLGNAWKFTGKQPQAVIEVGETLMEGEPAFFVRDNGAGFDPALADKLFGAFQRLHTTDEFPGAGIGLAIVQRIIHRHGGRVWAVGAVGEGATFYFTLPLK